jgi:hypothetical protein
VIAPINDNCPITIKNPPANIDEIKVVIYTGSLTVDG